MTKELLKLIFDKGELPQGTRIKTTIGGIHTGESHELPEWQIANANSKSSGWVPFWIYGWDDLHSDLILPANS